MVGNASHRAGDSAVCAEGNTRLHE